MGKADLNLHVSGICSKIEPEKFLKKQIFGRQMSAESPIATKALDNALHLPVPLDF